MIRHTIHFQGRVQGVGFRYTACRIAQCHQVCGIVQNLPDGRVRLVAEGAAADLEAFVKDLRAQMSDHIQDARIEQGAAGGEFGQPGRGRVVVRY